MRVIRKILHLFIPPPRWRFPVIILLGIFFGLGFQVLYVSNAISYASDKPEACINCHVMNSYYATWEKGSHGRVTVCNDCHVPQDNIFSKYYFKATDGLRHSFMFTFRLEPQVIRIHKAGREAVQGNCIRCHDNVIHPISNRGYEQGNRSIEMEGVYCWDCHREVPHGRVNSLSSTPDAKVPGVTPPVPAWIDSYNSKKKIED
ncbi:MAG: cytochrome c nitrite reductase small subunit [Ignavibacteriales bacterium]|nr:MAG: cytochrome c nitrite reductase small subunit [Ignavibacteriaceae bacterium]MBW7873210.1 cytochrome c nitrite reductase small subunit [Ignavibacteria bacterium]MCZ2142852.1 cytochrome c nitrite reductase small subunit [Ignavibacteriales bacterium]OQY69569.1 MAG: cytochrome c nitrite reductase small subunit [Ignavibacteriales bacterium UTCHB3]MBV6443946.1 hypothetical protein [Ignavibacteriaceae bacterium]